MKVHYGGRCRGCASAVAEISAGKRLFQSMLKVFPPRSSSETGPRCSSPVEAGDRHTNLQAKQNHSPSGECPICRRLQTFRAFSFFCEQPGFRQQTQPRTQREASPPRLRIAAPRAAPTARKTTKPRALLPIPPELVCLERSQMTSKGQ